MKCGGDAQAGQLGAQIGGRMQQQVVAGDQTRAAEADADQREDDPHAHERIGA